MLVKDLLEQTKESILIERSIQLTEHSCIQEKGRKAASKEIQKTDRCDLKIRSGSLRRNDHF